MEKPGCRKKFPPGYDAGLSMSILSPIYCIGGATVDVKIKSHHALQRATSNPAHTTMTFGGVAHNVARNLANWTSSIHLQTLLGNDQAGQQILMELAQAGIHTEHTQVINGVSTAHYYAVLDCHGELDIALADMAIFNHTNASFTSAWQNWPANSIIFLDTNLPENIIEQAIQFTTLHKLRLCIDPVSTFKAKKLPANWPPFFLIKPNLLEASTLAGISITTTADCFEAGTKLHQRGAQNVIISMGDEGYMIINDQIKKHVKPKSIPTIQDVNGAGDAFIAGILYGLQKNVCIDEACEYGANAAAIAIQSLENVRTQTKGMSNAAVF